jgi:hypothetical protein
MKRSAMLMGVGAGDTSGTVYLSYLQALAEQSAPFYTTSLLASRRDQYGLGDLSSYQEGSTLNLVCLHQLLPIYSL